MKKSLMIVIVISLAILICLPYGSHIVYADSVVTVGDFVFDKSTGTIIEYNGTGKNLEIPSTIDGVAVTKLGDSMCNNLNALNNLRTVVIPEGVTELGAMTFAWCGFLESVNLPSTLTDIGVWTFQGCRILTDINIPIGITEMGHGIFWGCYELASVVIPEGVIKLGNQLFYECASLRKITIPKSVVSFYSEDNNPFGGTFALTIYGISGSFIESYATSHKISFVATDLQTPPPVPTPTPTSTITPSPTPTPITTASPTPSPTPVLTSTPILTITPTVAPTPIQTESVDATEDLGTDNQSLLMWLIIIAGALIVSAGVVIIIKKRTSK